MEDNSKRMTRMYWECVAGLTCLTALFWAFGGVVSMINGGWTDRMYVIVGPATFFWIVVLLLAITGSAMVFIDSFLNRRNERYQAKLNRIALRFHLER